MDSLLNKTLAKLADGLDRTSSHAEWRGDADKWVTINGAKVLIGEGGDVKGGAGGKLSGKKFPAAKSGKGPPAKQGASEPVNMLPGKGGLTERNNPGAERRASPGAQVTEQRKRDRLRQNTRANNTTAAGGGSSLAGAPGMANPRPDPEGKAFNDLWAAGEKMEPGPKHAMLATMEQLDLGLRSLNAGFPGALMKVQPIRDPVNAEQRKLNSLIQQHQSHVVIESARNAEPHVAALKKQVAKLPEGLKRRSAEAAVQRMEEAIHDAKLGHAAPALKLQEWPGHDNLSAKVNGLVRRMQGREGMSSAHTTLPTGPNYKAPSAPEKPAHEKRRESWLGRQLAPRIKMI